MTSRLQAHQDVAAVLSRFARQTDFVDEPLVHEGAIPNIAAAILDALWGRIAPEPSADPVAFRDIHDLHGPLKAFDDVGYAPGEKVIEREPALVEGEPTDDGTWWERADDALRDALAGMHDNSPTICDVIANTALALDCLYACSGDLEADRLAMLEDHFREPDPDAGCICPPDLKAHGGFKGGCPACT